MKPYGSANYGQSLWLGGEPASSPPPTPGYYIAHRGGALVHPENTQEAFDWATSRGYPIELDVVELADGEYAVMHDLALDRVTNGAGPTAALTSEQWLGLRCDIIPRRPGTLMTLSQVLARYGPDATFVIDHKQGGIPALASILDSYSWARDRVVVMSLDRATCKAVVDAGYRASFFVYSQSQADATPAWGLLSDGIDHVSIQHDGAGVTASTFSSYMDAGLTTFAFTVNERAQAQRLHGLGIGVMSDQPDHVSREEVPLMTRLRYNGLATSLGASLTDVATSITFDSKLTYAGGDVPTISGSDYIPLSILDADGNCAEVVHLTAYTSAATTGTITRGKEGTTGVAHDSAAVVTHGPLEGDGAPRLLGSSSKTSSQTSITTITDVTDLSVTATLDNTRRYRVDTVFRLLCASTSSARTVRSYMTLTDGSNNTLAPIADFQGYAPSTTAGSEIRLAGSSSFTHEPASSGSFTYKVRCQTPSASSETTVEASSAAPCVIYVWDMGPQ